MKRNLTIQLDEAIVAKARSVAARRSVSISHLVRQQIEALAAQDTSYQTTLQRAFRRMDKGFNSGTKTLPGRDDLHDR